MRPVLGKRCQAVIAVGGGSCIDSGKCVAFMQRNPGRIRDYLLDPTLPRRKGVPFIAIPTTSGTGSEVTFGVVITDSQSGRKSAPAGRNSLPPPVFWIPCLPWGFRAL